MSFRITQLFVNFFTIYQLIVNNVLNLCIEIIFKSARLLQPYFDYLLVIVLLLRLGLPTLALCSHLILKALRLLLVTEY